MAKKRTNYFVKDNGTMEHRFRYNGKKYSVYGKNPEECEAKKLAKIEAIKNKTLNSNTRITLAEYYDVWQEQRENSITKSTRYTNDRRFKPIKEILGKERVADIETYQVIKLRNKLLETMKASTVNDEIVMLKSIMESAVEDRIRVDNPCKSRKLKPLCEDDEAERIGDTKHRALSKKELELFFNYARDNCWYYELFLFMLHTGCRVGEACALKWEDIDFTSEVIHIRKTVSRISNTEFEISKPKTAHSIRDIPLTDGAKRALTSQKQKQEIMQITGTIFGSARGKLAEKGVVNASISNILEKLNKQSGVLIPQFSSHAFRATFATNCAVQGMLPIVLKEILGHSDIRVTTKYYIHLSEESKKEALNSIEIAV